MLEALLNNPFPLSARSVATSEVTTATLALTCAVTSTLTTR